MIQVAFNKQSPQKEIGIKKNRTNKDITQVLEQGVTTETAAIGKVIDPTAPAVIAWAGACFAEGSQTTAE